MAKYVISDIHGCSNTLKSLIEKIGLNKIDSLYFLGDYIDKGRDSAGVIDFILSLREAGFQVFPIKGNHEENLIHALGTYDAKMFQNIVARINKSQNLLDSQGKLIEKYRLFCSKLPYFIELENFYLVHAGFDTKSQNILANTSAMIENRRFEYEVFKFKNKTVIHGHQVSYLPEIENAIRLRSKILPLDNGCVYNKAHKMIDYQQTGKLLCLNLDTFELISQNNVD